MTEHWRYVTPDPLGTLPSSQRCLLACHGAYDAGHGTEHSLGALLLSAVARLLVVLHFALGLRCCCRRRRIQQRAGFPLRRRRRRRHAPGGRVETEGETRGRAKQLGVCVGVGVARP